MLPAPWAPNTYLAFIFQGAGSYVRFLECLTSFREFYCLNQASFVRNSLTTKYNSSTLPCAQQAASVARKDVASSCTTAAGGSTPLARRALARSVSTGTGVLKPALATAFSSSEGAYTHFFLSSADAY